MVSVASAGVSALSHKLFASSRTRSLNASSSDASVSKGLKDLEGIGWLQRQRHRTGRNRGPVRETATYLVTPYSDSVRELANATAADLRQAIDEERQMRAEKRAQRIREWRQAKRWGA
jgi:hypothetical protein